MNWQTSLYEGKFSHIYVEKQAWSHSRTKAILARFPQAQVILIDNYKDIFCRSRQDVLRQHISMSLILAVDTNPVIYQGAKVCQSFDNDNFKYTSCVMNCLYDCDYCYLKGMYPSGNMVIFVNLEDTLALLDKELKQEDIYLCVSYDTDLLALEDITGFVKLWNDFTIAHDRLKTEIRTKCGRTDIWEVLEPSDRVIFAFTLSPEEIARDSEKGAASLKARLKAASMAQRAGFTVRLCFDPMIYCKDFKTKYGAMLQEVFETVDMNAILDVSVGSFRISAEYMKKIKKSQPYSATVQFPFENVAGVYQYPPHIREAMEGFLVDELARVLPREKIFTWE